MPDLARLDLDPPGHVWGRVERECPTQIGQTNLEEQVAGQQTGKRGGIISDLISWMPLAQQHHQQ